MLYDDQPALGPLIVDLGAVTAGAYRDIDVSSYVTTDGTYSFAIIGEVNDLARFDSREAANDPLLVVTP
jgi:acid phosphatase type 7